MSNKKILPGCGCCKGIEELTPHSISNDVGLRELSFRIGRHSTFKESMIRRLSDSPELGKLTVRVNDDSSIALFDAWALLLEVLSFYNERIINEGYLRTSTERLSLVELAKHISYRPKPGVAASTLFSFLMDESPGAPMEALLPIGTKVQSIPGQEEKPQLFETTEEIHAKTKWNGIKPQLTEKQTLVKGITSLYLQGTATQLQIGDKILILGEERIYAAENDRWEIRTLHSVTTEDGANRTLITWDIGLDQEVPLVHHGNNGKVLVFRQRAALFGHNASDYRVLSRLVKREMSSEYDAALQDWKKSIVIADNIIHLDAHYSKITANSWLASITQGNVDLYKVVANEGLTKKAYVLANKSSKVTLDKNFADSSLRETIILAQSEELPLAEAPILKAVYGNSIALENTTEELRIGQQLIISGEPVKQVILLNQNHINPILGGTSVALVSGDILEVDNHPQLLPDNLEKWFVRFGNIEGHVTVESGGLIPYQAPKTSAFPEAPTSLNQPDIVSELIEIAEIMDHNTILLRSPLTHTYLRKTVKINANVSKGTHGETKKEILGSGDGSQVFQKFNLKQKPLTYISSSSATGIESTLDIRVNDILWKEVPTLYNRTPKDRVYITRMEEDGSAYVQFGDGITGARLPSGAENVRAKYRVGIGFEGLVKSGQLSLLMTPQLGVKSVINPMSCSGAEEPESKENIQRNLPFTVLTMDRIVSIKDYENFTRAFAGIGKARADVLWKGEERTIHLTVAAADEGGIDDALRDNLLKAINAAAHKNFTLVTSSYEKISFGLNINVKVSPEYLKEKVFSAIETALLTAFEFQSRDFGQHVTPSEVIAIIQSVAGVIAVDLEKLDGLEPFSEEHFRLISNPARWDTDKEEIKPAQLLLIDPDKIEIGTMEA
ncbi:MAG TPA: putative baseplate assembly protein [Lunatimonas sp.]|nr:putative baseplate assembly protein [Lunatimonas sp.]